MTTMSSAHYLQRPQITLIFLALIGLTLPLVAIESWSLVSARTAELALFGYLVVIGNTHFVITWLLYLNSKNLAHFGSTTARRLVYFAVPALLLVGFCALGVFSLPPRGTSFAIVFATALIAVDYFHATRQSFGVLQLFKARTGAPFMPNLRRLENGYFLTLCALQLITFINGIDNDFDGYFDPNYLPSQIVLLAAAILLTLIVRGWIRAWREPGSDKRALLAAATYLMLQSAAAALVVYRSRLYIASLAMHYVEYHVLMMPRCFRSELDPATATDRLAAWLRRHKLLLGAVILLVATWMQAWQVFAFADVPITAETSRVGWFFVNCLNGIFLAHFFVEAFLWKFREPFFRDSLGPLYFATKGVERAA